MFLHIRPFCDSYYPSEYYPLRSTAENVDFDILEYIIAAFHQSNIRVHAWINPYRVRTADSNIEMLPEKSPARIWLEDKSTDNDTAVSLLDGIYLNPAHSDAVNLILSGIKEIVENYGIDGIHFDDYFYPTQSEAFDKTLYESYKEKNENALELKDWRRQHVNSLISSTQRIIKAKNGELIFSISPAASIEKNYEELYADVSFWIENEYMDWLIPQLYFGYQYPQEEFRFDNLLSEWGKLSKKGDVELIIGLASYKIGTDTEYEAEEWNKGDIISKQTMDCFDNNYGCSYFSYSSLFGTKPLETAERENLISKLN